MRQFRIDDSERERILNLHESATKRQYLSEQLQSREFTSDFKDIDGADEYGENAKFKVTFGGENAIFNGKEGYNGAIITPLTTITLTAGQGGIILSGMGKEIKIDTTNDGLEIIKDVA
jgi:hypothetical protein